MSTLDRRSFIAAGAAAATLPALSACGGSSSGESSGSLQFILSGDANQGGGFTAMAQKYQEETGTVIEVVDLPYDDLQTKVNNAAKANDLPAIARMPALDPVWLDRTRDLSTLAEQVKPIRGMYATDAEGKVPALPSDLTAVGLFLNKSVWDEAGLEYPTTVDENVWTWDEFEEAARTVRDSAGIRYAMAVDATSHRLSAFLFQHGSEGVSLTEDLSEYVANAETAPALQRFADLNDDEFIPRSVWLSQDDPNAMFKTGQVASYFSGSWQIADFSENIADFEWVCVPMPKQPVQATNYGTSAHIVVFDGTGQEDEAYAFVEWLYQPENYAELSTISGFLPSIEDIEVAYDSHQDSFDLYNAEIAATPDFVGEIKARELALQAAGTAASLGTDPVQEETVKLIAGDQTAEEAVAAMIETLNGTLD
ncbi:extracellular solute-binding protein [Brachybacterium sp. GCM10030267]|uniref:extracellular solute-binding protein n=1 Tax=Brachybacterium sp. GCM10030267 TaxID=3273381 RepID=UPI00360AECBA